MDKEKTKKIWKITGIVLGVIALSAIPLAAIFSQVIDIVSQKPTPPSIPEKPTPPNNEESKPLTNQEILNRIHDEHFFVKQTRKYNDSNNTEQEEINYFVGVISYDFIVKHMRLFYPSKYANNAKMIDGKTFKYTKNIFEVASLQDSVGKSLQDINFKTVWTSNILKPFLYYGDVLPESFINIDDPQGIQTIMNMKKWSFNNGDENINFEDRLLSSLYIENGVVNYFLGNIKPKEEIGASEYLINDFQTGPDNLVRDIPVWPYDGSDPEASRVNLSKSWMSDAKIIDGSFIINRDYNILYLSYGLNTSTNSYDFLISFPVALY